jgi:hypothetical protein
VAGRITLSGGEECFVHIAAAVSSQIRDFAGEVRSFQISRNYNAEIERQRLKLNPAKFSGPQSTTASAVKRESFSSVWLPEPDSNLRPTVNNRPFNTNVSNHHLKRRLFVLLLLTRFRSHSGGKPCEILLRLTPRSRRGLKTQELSCLLSLLKNTRHSEGCAINRRVVSSSRVRGAKPTRNTEFRRRRRIILLRLLP